MPVAPQGLVTFPGVNQIVSATMTFSQGITPSCCTMEIAPQADFAASLGTLTWTFDNTVFQFVQCRVDKQSVRMTTQGQVVSLQIYDRRWKWVYPTISGYYNQVLFQGTPNTENDTILNGTRQTAQQLASIILDTMGESGYDVSQVPNDIYPPVDWDYTNAAKALADLAEQCGCRVVLKQNNTVQIAKAGFGNDLPSGSVMEFNAGAIGIVVPDAIQIVLGKTRFQIDFQLLPVGLDTDGSIKPIDELSYTPQGGWANSLPDSFRELSAEAAPGNEVVPNVVAQPNSPRDCALKSVWRWYSITDNGTPYTIPGYKQIKNIEQVLPIDSVQAETRMIGGKKIPKPAIVYGNFARKDGVFGNYTTMTEYKKPFSINSERGIVEFREPVYQWVGSGTTFSRDDANIFLRTSFNLRDNKDNGWVRYIAELDVPGATGTVGVRAIVHDEINAAYWNLYDTQGNYTGESNNLNADLATEIDYDMQAALAEYEVKFPIEAVYPGLVPIDLDGAVQQITWSVGTGGATTRVSRNSEHSIVVPSYKQRRFSEIQRLADFRERQASIANAVQGAANPNNVVNGA